MQLTELALSYVKNEEIALLDAIERIEGIGAPRRRPVACSTEPNLNVSAARVPA
jgi:hypothetical protein